MFSFLINFLLIQFQFSKFVYFSWVSGMNYLMIILLKVTLFIHSKAITWQVRKKKKKKRMETCWNSRSIQIGPSCICQCKNYTASSRYIKHFHPPRGNELVSSFVEQERSFPTTDIMWGDEKETKNLDTKFTKHPRMR